MTYLIYIYIFELFNRNNKKIDKNFRFLRMNQQFQTIFLQLILRFMLGYFEMKLL